MLFVGNKMKRRLLRKISFIFLLYFGIVETSGSLILDHDFDAPITNLTKFRNPRIEENLIPPDYSIHLPPPTENNQPTNVDFSVLIINVRDILEIQERIVLEMNLRMVWQDTRMRHLDHEIQDHQEFLILNPILISKIWHPDVFIDRVKSITSQELISKPHSLRYYPGGYFRYSSRITIELSCPMDFHYYPADTQRCFVDMKSYAYADNILVFNWEEGRGAALVDNLALHNFGTCVETTDDYMVFTSSGNYSGISFTVVLQRRLNYHLIQTYIPSFLFIIVSWLSFLVPPESIPGRIAMTMMTLLTLTAMFSSVRQSTPNVSYIKALDIWMVMCIIFVFLSLFEYAILLKLRGKKPKMISKKRRQRPVRLKYRNSYNTTSPRNDNDSVTTTFSGYNSPQIKFVGQNEPILTRLNKFFSHEETPVGNNIGPKSPPITQEQPTAPPPPVLEIKPPENEDRPPSPANMQNNHSPQITINSVTNKPFLLLPSPKIQRRHSTLSVRDHPLQRRMSTVSMVSLNVPQQLTPIPQPSNKDKKKEEEKEKEVNKWQWYIRKIERSTWVIVPTLFFCFGLIYWPWLLANSDYYSDLCKK